MADSPSPPRIFMTAWFARVARKALIAETELCRTAGQAARGQADDLGGGVFKRRLNRNEYRAILLAKAGGFWVYEYLFAKKDMENIDAAELRAFRMLAKSYASLTDSQVKLLLRQMAWIEICKEMRP